MAYDRNVVCVQVGHKALNNLLYMRDTADNQYASLLFERALKLVEEGVSAIKENRESSRNIGGISTPHRPRVKK